MKDNTLRTEIAEVLQPTAETMSHEWGNSKLGEEVWDDPACNNLLKGIDAILLAIKNRLPKERTHRNGYPDSPIEATEEDWLIIGFNNCLSKVLNRLLTSKAQPNLSRTRGGNVAVSTQTPEKLADLIQEAMYEWSDGWRFCATRADQFTDKHKAMIMDELGNHPLGNYVYHDDCACMLDWNYKGTWEGSYGGTNSCGCECHKKTMELAQVIVAKLQESDKVRSHPDLPTTPGEVKLPMPNRDEGKEK
jgi:hypothetical protein